MLKKSARVALDSLAIVALVAVADIASAQILSVPPAQMPARTEAFLQAEKASSALLLTAGAPARTIALAAPATAESGILKRQPITLGDKPGVSRKSRRATIGFPRSPAEGDRTLILADLPWQGVAGDMQAARIVVSSPMAAAVRVGFSLVNAPAGLIVRYQGSGDGAQAFGPGSVPAATLGGGLQWSPVLDGSTATIELALPAGTVDRRATIAIPMISHLAASGAALKQADPLRQIGTSGACEIDVACVTGAIVQQSATATNAVARMVFTDLGVTYLCTGSLLNDSVNSGTPYFYSANHCIDDDDSDPAASRGAPAAAAATINTFWFFQTSTCGVHTSATVNFTQVAGGMRLLARSVDFDWALLQMNLPPPPGVSFAAWNASVVPVGSAVVGIHHPNGDLKKFSQGSVTNYATYSDRSSFIEAQWSQGVTEPGSSGSGLFVLNPAAGYYELRGGLFGGASDCSVPKGIDDYSRLDNALPLLTSYLTPSAANPTKTAPVVEFYNGALNDYFLTVNVPEINDLDNGVHPGWVRTGLRFLAYTDPAFAPTSVSPVCRFYVAPAFGDSHFYSASPAECTATAQKFAAQWIYESPAVFYIILPDTGTGACPANSRAIYRFLNDANGLHHRYTAEVDVRDSTIQDLGWTLEGYGNPPEQVVMCTPLT